MKKTLILAIVSALSLNASAVWQTSNTDTHVLAQPGLYGQAELHMAVAGDGSLVATWLRRNAEDNGYYYLHMQIFDPNGNPKLGDNGQVVASHATDTYVSDYNLAMTPDDKIVISYADTRTAPSDSHVYLYCYDMQGHSVWCSEGVSFPAETVKGAGTESPGSILVSDDVIYVSVRRTEQYEEKATEENWKPNPMNPNQPMPETVRVTGYNTQVLAYDTNGRVLWPTPIILSSPDAAIVAADDGIIAFCLDSTDRLIATCFDASAAEVWEQSTVVDSRTFPRLNYKTPKVERLNDGMYILTYRYFEGTLSYIGINGVFTDGDLYLDKPINSCENQIGGNWGQILATNGTETLVAWQCSANENKLMINQISADLSYMWTGDRYEGVTLCADPLWNTSAYKIIPVEQGWVVMCSVGTAWNATNVMLKHIDAQGHVLQSKLLNHSDWCFADMTPIVVGDKLILGYVEAESEESTDHLGGLRLMCVSYTGEWDEAGINDTYSDSSLPLRYYDLRGIEVANPVRGIYVKDQGSKIEKIIMK